MDLLQSPAAAKGKWTLRRRKRYAMHSRSASLLVQGPQGRTGTRIRGCASTLTLSWRTTKRPSSASATNHALRSGFLEDIIAGCPGATSCVSAVATSRCRPASSSSHSERTGQPVLPPGGKSHAMGVRQQLDKPGNQRGRVCGNATDVNAVRAVGDNAVLG
jgi:hypothetical protein